MFLALVEIIFFLFAYNLTLKFAILILVLLAYIWRMHSIRCPELEYYIQNRDTILNEFEDRDKGKTAFLKAVNDDKHNDRVKNSLIFQKV